MNWLYRNQQQSCCRVLLGLRFHLSWTFSLFIRDLAVQSARFSGGRNCEALPSSAGQLKMKPLSSVASCSHSTCSWDITVHKRRKKKPTPCSQVLKWIIAGEMIPAPSFRLVWSARLKVLLGKSKIQLTKSLKCKLREPAFLKCTLQVFGSYLQSDGGKCQWLIL